jgi:diacylglycerol kinase family enzyme
VIVFVNTHASYGRAARRWQRVVPEIEKLVGGFEVKGIDSPEGVAATLREGVSRGEHTVVAAGGDGTVNMLVNAIMALGDGEEVTLGAVGLGSSNDFHKPFRSDAFVAGVPVRLDCAAARPHDVIRIDTEDDDGHQGTRYAIINASLGMTAEANAAFNAPTGLTRAARRLSVDAAIAASVLRTLATYRDVGCRMAIDGEDLGTFSVSNLGVIKNPHFAGSFCYDMPIEPDDGNLGVNLCERLTRFQALATLAALRRRRFRGRPKTRSWTGQRVSVEGDRTFALETDGEVTETRRAEFHVVPGRIRCCS